MSARDWAIMAVALGLLGNSHRSIEPYRPPAPPKPRDTHLTPNLKRAKVKAARKQRSKKK